LNIVLPDLLCEKIKHLNAILEAVNKFGNSKRRSRSLSWCYTTAYCEEYKGVKEGREEVKNILKLCYI
jgi:hypothetical protein